MAFQKEVSVYSGVRPKLKLWTPSAKAKALDSIYQS
jgi:hypothetical protein